MSLINQQLSMHLYYLILIWSIVKNVLKTFLANEDLDDMNFDDPSSQSVYISKTALRGIIKRSNRNDSAET